MDAAVEVQTPVEVEAAAESETWVAGVVDDPASISSIICSLIPGVTLKFTQMYKCDLNTYLESVW